MATYQSHIYCERKLSLKIKVGDVFLIKDDCAIINSHLLFYFEQEDSGKAEKVCVTAVTYNDCCRSSTMTANRANYMSNNVDMLPCE